MAAAGTNYSDFDYILLKASKDNKRKVTKKRSNLESKLGEKYPPEGHCSVLRHSGSTSAGVNKYRMLELGGARNGEDATWGDASTLNEFIVSVAEDDVSIASVTPCRTTGGSIRPMHGSSLVDFDSKLLLWGGLDLRLFSTRDELLVIEEQPQQKQGGAPHFHVTWIQTLEKQTPSRRGLIVPYQSGSVPSGRAGHTMTRIPGSNKVFLFGGVYYERNGQHSRWNKWCKDGKLYILDTDSYEWTTAKCPLLQARSHHTADILEDNDYFVMPIIGGVLFEGQVATYRESLAEITIVRMDKQLQNFSLSEISFQPSPDTQTVYISSHATVVQNGNILVVGGIQDAEKKMVPDKTPTPSSKAYIIDFQNRTYNILPRTVGSETVFATYGHSIHTIETDNSTILFGGFSRQISLLSNRNYEPAPCENVPCNIVDSPEFRDPTWILCENPRCMKWFHTFCLKLNKIPKDKYYCKNCK